MRPDHSTLCAGEVHHLTHRWFAPVLGPWPAVRRCTQAVVCAVLTYAAHRLSSVSDACARLTGAPNGDTVLGLLARLGSDPEVVERRLRVALVRFLPRTLRRGRWIVAIDTTLIPYHGQPHAHPAEIYRGQPKSGTSHFHAYATAAVVHHGRRFTLALVAVRAGTAPQAVVRELLRRVRAGGVRIGLVLLDRGFNTGGVVRYLQAARTRFVMPQAIHGSTPARGPLTGLRAIRAAHPTGWTTHAWQPREGGRRVTVDLCVCRRRRRDRRGHRVFLYACWGVTAAPGWVRATYRRRFGVETSYRQMNRARIRTSTRRPAVRLLFVGLALLLRNLWAWLHWTALAERRRGGRRVRLERLRFATLLLWLAHVAEQTFGYRDRTRAEAPPTDDLRARRR